MQAPACTGLHRCHIDSGAACAEQIRTWSLDNPTWLVMADSTRVAVAYLTVGRDSVRWRQPKTMASASAARDSVLAVHIKRHGKGGARGFGFGFLGGVVFGAMMGATADAGDSMAGNAEWAAFGAGVFGAASGLLGLIGGGIAGYTEVFELGPAAPEPVPPDEAESPELFATGGAPPVGGDP